MNTEPNTSAGSEDPNKARILIAEDNFINQTVAVKILQKLGYEADVANDGKEAVEKALFTPYDLILMDMEMPVMNGIEATQEIRENEQSASVGATIIALTANVMGDDRDRCIKAGMNDFLTKPMTTQVTADKLAEYL